MYKTCPTTKFTFMVANSNTAVAIIVDNLNCVHTEVVQYEMVEWTSKSRHPWGRKDVNEGLRELPVTCHSYYLLPAIAL